MAMRSLLMVIIGGAIVCSATLVSLEGKNPPPREYVGSKKCRICHNAPSKGKMHAIWSETNHAHAHQTLLSPEAREAAKKLGIEEPRKSGDCLRCHATAYGFGKKKVSSKVSIEEGVGCESCHGPGKEYSRINIMKDRQKAVAAGLIDPPKNVCTKCHSPESPTWNPERYTDKKGNKTGFDFEVLWEMIEHSVPKKVSGS